LWNIETGNYHIIKTQDFINTVTFSPINPLLLLTSSWGGLVQQWDIDGHQIGSPIPGNHVAFSPDGTQFVSYKETTVTIQNTGSRRTVVE